MFSPTYRSVVGGLQTNAYENPLVLQNLSDCFLKNFKFISERERVSTSGD